MWFEKMWLSVGLLVVLINLGLLIVCSKCFVVFV